MAAMAPEISVRHLYLLSPLMRYLGNMTVRLCSSSSSTRHCQVSRVVYAAEFKARHTRRMQLAVVPGGKGSIHEINVTSLETGA